MKPKEVFERLRASGSSPVGACRVATNLGLNKLERLVGLRQAYSLSLVEAKDVLLRESGAAADVDENQAEIAKILLGAGPDQRRKLLEGES